MIYTAERLMKIFTKLPGIGPKSAQRIVLHLISKENHDISHQLTEEISSALAILKNCEICGNMCEKEKICTICKDPQREKSTICVVERVSDLWAIEKCRIYYGSYHVLNGVLSAIEGIGPEDINLHTLLQRIENENIEELIIATNSTLDGQTTFHYISDIIENKVNKISRLANGIPVGGEIDYLDEGTLFSALNSRITVKM